MRLLATLALTLSLGLTAAPADARAAATPDPAVVTALNAAVEHSYSDAWDTESGTVTIACRDDQEGDDLTVIEYDEPTDTKRTRTTWENDVPTDLVERGRTRYSRTVPAVRKSLRVHRAPRPPKWVKTRGAVGVESPRADLWGEDAGDEPTISEATWEELTMTANPGGGSTFAGKLAGGQGNGANVTAVTDAAGRLVRVDESDCVTTWTWARPQITIPKKARANPHRVRYQWERKAVVRMMGLTWQANQQLESGVPEAEVIAWLHTKVPAKRQRAQGIKLVQGKAKRGAKPAIAFKIKVAGGTASWKPVR